MERVIQVMPDWLSNQIAAGEVVERPASIVKELVENSLDAGARRVVVEYAGGGAQLVRVVDDGSGMSREDALLSVERHATSKLKTIDDLRSIRTFGFRGEALPSIASVSRFVLRTRRREDAVGTEIRMEEPGRREVADAALSPGTEVEVRELFHSVPARRKFLKKESTESGAVIEVVQRMALAHHDVHIQLVGDGRRLLDAPAEADPLARIYAVLGKKVCEKLFECFLEGRIRVTGFVSDPESKRRDASGMFTFVNGRFVRDKVVTQAVMSAYGSLLSRGEYPYAVLHVSVPPAEVDVNVHPAKSEVRFERGSEVFAAVSRAVRLTLVDTPWVKDGFVSAPPVLRPAAEPEAENPVRPAPLPAPVSAVRSGSAPVLRDGDEPVRRDACEPVLRFDAAPVLPAGPAPQGPLPVRGKDAAASGSFARMVYLGQYRNCFLLGQVDDRLIVIDQHAAHERVMFERIREQFEKGPVVSQRLLVPMLLELDLRLVAVLEERRELLERLGFVVEPFGSGSVAVKAVPLLLKQRNPELPLMAVLSDLADAGGLAGPELFHKTLATMACHSAVRAGDPMERAEVLALLRQMDQVDLAAYCPHGRPVVAMFDESEVARWFKRT
jgi:DNA mismatch repair protein MutL